MASAVKRLTLKDVVVGGIFRLSPSHPGQHYGYQTGDSVIVTYRSGNGINIQDVAGTKQQINVNLASLLPNISTKEDITKKLEELTNDIETYKAQLDWMDATKSEEYNETEFKVWNTLKVLNSASSDIEKARVIAKLITG